MANEWEALTHRVVSMLSTIQRISTQMYALDSHMGRKFLSGGDLCGRTATIAANVNPRLSKLWLQYSALTRLGGTLKSCVEAGDSNTSATRARRILDDQIVMLGPDEIPVDSASKATKRLKLDQLARAVDDESRELIDIYDDVDKQCAALAERLTDIGANLAIIEAGIQAGHDTTKLDALRERRVIEFTKALDDPYAAVTSSSLQEFADDTKEYAATIADIDDLRTQHQARIKDLRAQAEALKKTEDATVAECALATEKIAQPRPPTIEPVYTDIAQLLMSAQEEATNEQWQDLARTLARTGEQILLATVHATRAHTTALTLLNRRRELRGRFAAYTSKASRLGVIEDETIMTAINKADKLVRTVPCDLPAATQAIYQFQQALQTPAKEPRR